MSFRINENQPPNYFRNSIEPTVREENLSDVSVSPAANSKIGENNLYGLLQKNALRPLSTVSGNELNAPTLTAPTHSIFTRAGNQVVPVSAVRETDRSIIDKIAETFATAVNSVFPFEGTGFDMFPPLVPVSEHLTMGNPSNAEIDVSQPNNYLLVKDQYTASYDRDRGIPNWTSWHLDSGSLGSTRRQNDFRPDETLPDGWYQVLPEDYRGSGYDRGHMTPSGDRTSSVEDNSATFLMTNMIPQASKNNQQTWANLEEYCRELVGQGNELYIVSGGNGTKEYLADGRVAVPEHTWKVILVQPEGTDDVSRVTADTRVISVYVPNDDNVVSDWRNYTVSADYVEAQTGYDFFSELPDEIENQIEAKING